MFIRRATRGEAGQITDVHNAAFDNGPDGAQARLVVDLRADGHLIPELSLVAIENRLIVGHVAISPADVGGHHATALGPLGVIPSRHRSGVGTALMHAVLAVADARGEPLVVLLGSPDYYGRFGFLNAATLGITTAEVEWRRSLQARRLAGYDEAMRGPFTYAPAFSRVPNA